MSKRTQSHKQAMMIMIGFSGLATAQQANQASAGICIKAQDNSCVVPPTLYPVHPLYIVLIVALLVQHSSTRG